MCPPVPEFSSVVLLLAPPRAGTADRSSYAACAVPRLQGPPPWRHICSVLYAASLGRMAAQVGSCSAILTSQNLLRCFSSRGMKSRAAYAVCAGDAVGFLSGQLCIDTWLEILASQQGVCKFLCRMGTHDEIFYHTARNLRHCTQVASTLMITCTFSAALRLQNHRIDMGNELITGRRHKT